MKKAKDVMSKDVMAVNLDTRVLDAMKILVEHRITGLPVISDKDEVIGIISENDMLNMLFLPDKQKATVGEYMSFPVTSCDEEDYLLDVCNCLIKNGFRRVPILSNRKLVGIVSRHDIIKSAIEEQLSTTKN